MQKIKAGIIGSGRIGGHLASRLGNLGFEVHLLRRPRGDLNARSWVRFDALDLVFLCISTKDKGEAARDYIRFFAEQGIPVVTCEKGGLAYHAAELWKFVGAGFVGYRAAVGGGTHMLPYLAGRRPRQRPMEIEVVLNGTLNFIFTQVAEKGVTLGEACDEARRLGYAEPGAKDPLSLINGELADMRMKTCVLYNTQLSEGPLAGRFVNPDEFVFDPLGDGDIEILSRSARQYRPMVVFSSQRMLQDGEFFRKGFATTYGKVDGWHLRGGFRNIFADAELDWLPGGVGNGICITEGKLGIGGKYTLLGPGAGLEPTTTAMINDALSLLEDLRPEDGLISATKVKELFSGSKRSDA